MPVNAEQARWMGEVLGVNAVAADTADDAPDMRRWKAVRSIWDRASADAQQQLGELRKSLGRSDDPELQAIAETELKDLTKRVDVPLESALDAIAGAGLPPEPRTIDAARRAVDRYLEHLTSDPRIAACDANPFGTSVQLADTLIPALEELDAALLRWARG